MKTISLLITILLLLNLQLLYSQEEKTTTPTDTTKATPSNATDTKVKPAEAKIADEVLKSFDEYPYDIVNDSLNYVPDKDFYSNKGYYIEKNKSQLEEKQPALKELNKDKVEEPATKEGSDKEVKTVEPVKKVENQQKNVYKVKYNSLGLIEEVWFEKYDKASKKSIPDYSRNFDYIKYYRIKFEYNDGLLTEKNYLEINDDVVCKYIYSRDRNGAVNRIEKKFKKKFAIKGETDSLETRYVIEFIYGGTTLATQPTKEAPKDSKPESEKPETPKTPETTSTGTQLSNILFLDANNNIIEQYVTENNIPKGMPQRVEKNKRNHYVGEVQIPIWLVKKYIRYQPGTSADDKDNDLRYLYYFNYYNKGQTENVATIGETKTPAETTPENVKEPVKVQEPTDNVRVKEYHIRNNASFTPIEVSINEYINTIAPKEKAETKTEKEATEEKK